ncbi:TonB-linked SusC/RagA family outer membrane protein [Winogradskyella pacifica]|jgi:TonB-linked SusC/RagA family outer membrane protein|uniref:TonB-linked SusC/RagA family outer membrane protein n=1 Tax=Winogradskyella pacifica TaxID=664642 RepID=A0A3D9MD52_9FLAO|nr:TonB-dependent receptor [Winogradskyella pacifica]REE16947.1 TonB-linked SusC/RagA family outer membrane protein [Winogradskyella pacifica]
MNLKVKLTTIIALLFSVMIFAQDSYTLTGTVTSAVDNMPIPGANIIIIKTTRGATTDFDGNYQLEVSKGDVVQFSYVGYVTQTVIIDAQTTYSVQLVEDANTLEEVVVVGYGTQKKSHLTGAISKVKNENLDQIAVARVDDALIGQVSGVNIQATSAEAGAAPTITIRGFGSIAADSGPAVVVDGIVVSSDFLGSLNMNDVESFEVLKDAASAAIYGSEGANGVILITTKSGKEGKTRFSYDTYTGFKEAHESEDYKKSVSGWAAQEMAATGELSNTTKYAQLLVETLGVDRDWQEVFFDGGTITSHSFSARGGTKDTKFSSSLSFLEDEGVVITDNYKLLTGRLKLDTKLTKNLRFGINATPSYSKRRALPTSIHNPLRQSPWLPIYHTAESLQFTDPAANIQVGDYFAEDDLINIDVDPTDSFGASRPRTTGDSNPYAQYVEREHYEYNTKLLGSTYLEYEIIDGLKAKTSLGVTLDFRKRTRWDGTLHHSGGAGRAAYSLENRFRSRIISDNTLNYSKTIGDHDFDVLAGFSVQSRNSELSSIEGSGYSNDLLKNLEGATLFTEPVEINLVQRKIGYFARVNYAYANKYLLSASFRRDGSSVFGIDSKWGNFPAVSVGWNVSKEDFLIDSGFLNNLKFRFSYGLTGSENFDTGNDITDVWPYLALLDNNNAITEGGVTAGVSALNIANALLQWEASEEYNPGVDFAILNNRISGSVDYYKRTSDKLLLENPVSYVSGFNSGIVNLGKVENSGWEFELRTKNIAKENFSWSTTVIASTNKNKLLDMGDSDGALLEDTFGRNSQWINSVGNPLSSFYGYVVDEELGIEYYDSPWIPINGRSEDVIVKDLNGDGIITDEDKTILGDPYPDIVWSLTNEFKIGDFDFSFMLQGSQGAQVKNIGDQYFGTDWTGATTSPQAVVDAGVISHTSFLQQRVHTNDVVQSAGYFSLRNINLGYTIPDSVVSKIGVEKLRIYATAQNLVYITSDEYHGFNPEFVDDSNPRQYGAQRGGTPIFKTLSLGLNVNF